MLKKTAAENDKVGGKAMRPKIGLQGISNKDFRIITKGELCVISFNKF